jgi:hypothetical protein
LLRHLEAGIGAQRVSDNHHALAHTLTMALDDRVGWRSWQ